AQSPSPATRGRAATPGGGFGNGSSFGAVRETGSTFFSSLDCCDEQFTIVTKAADSMIASAPGTALVHGSSSIVILIMFSRRSIGIIRLLNMLTLRRVVPALRASFRRVSQKPHPNRLCALDSGQQHRIVIAPVTTSIGAH